MRRGGNRRLSEWPIVENEAIHASSRLRESLNICSAAAESSVELEADCCTSSRILSMARTTRLRAGGLFFDGGINFLGDFREAAGGLGDLRRADRLLGGGRADFLREFVNFGNHVRNLVAARRLDPC